jgi:hypothetical protein
LWATAQSRGRSDRAKRAMVRTVTSLQPHTAADRLRGMSSLGTVAIVVLVVNLPFGFWRAGVKRFTLPWFVAVHAPVPLVVGLRVLSGLGWQLSTVPALAGAFLAGQFFGGRLRYWWENRRRVARLGS